MFTRRSSTSLSLIVGALAIGAAVSPTGCNDEPGPPDSGDPEAKEIPMTGEVSDLFAPVDIAMRQFMKTRCVGAGVLAISRKDGKGRSRTVYRRGFGRMHGAATDRPLAGCKNGPASAKADPYDPSSTLVQPNTPLPLGSVSKTVTAAVVRRAVAARLASLGLPSDTAGVEAAKLFDPALDLFPEALRRLFVPNSSADACPPVLVTDTNGDGTSDDATCGRRACAGAVRNGADLRWADVTIGQLLGHKSGLPRSAPDWDRYVLSNLDKLRGYDGERAAYAEENQSIVSQNGAFADGIQATREEIRDRLGLAAGDDVYYLNRYDVLGGGGEADEIYKVLAGRCLATTPGTSYVYANTGFALLQRVLEHITANGYAAPLGAPVEHAGSEVDLFLAELGVPEGVASDEGVFRLQTATGIPGYTPPHPVPRLWDGSTHYGLTRDEKRPFCVFPEGGSGCSTSVWKKNAGDNIRPGWDFGIDGDTIAKVPSWTRSIGLTVGTGSLVAEAPVMLRLINRYVPNMNTKKQPLIGRDRTTCGADCDVTTGKNGSDGAGYAWAMSLGTTDQPTSALLPYPPRPEGEGFGLDIAAIPVDPEMNKVPVSLPGAVDFVVAVNQDKDPRPPEDQFSYAYLKDFILFGLSQVDWAAVDRELSMEEHQVVGIAQAQGNTVYWYKDGTWKIRAGAPDAHFGSDSALSSGEYQAASTRIGADIVGIAVNSANRVYTFYGDGVVSQGSYGKLDQDGPGYTRPYAFKALPGMKPSDILAIDISSDDRVFTWYRGGKRSIGTSADLDVHGSGTFVLPPGQTEDDIVDVSIEKANDHCWVLYRDGSVSEGSSGDLGQHGYQRGPVAGLAMDHSGLTHVWYASGLHRAFGGNLADNIDPKTPHESNFYDLPGGRSGYDVAEIRLVGKDTETWYDDGVRSSGSTTVLALDAGGSGLAKLPPGQTWQDVVGIDVSEAGDVFSWYKDGTLAKGNHKDLAAKEVSTFQLPPGQTAAMIEGVAIDSQDGGSGDVWTLYRDGSASSGTPEDLDANGYWPAP